jgi:DNA-binding LytR/AlgR family response regulator
LKSYSVKADNYILKPITEEKLLIVFDEMLEHLQTEEDDVVIVRSKDGIQKITISNLAFAEVLGNNVLYHLSNGRVIECTETLSKACDKLLKYGCFFKPHRCYLVNMQYIQTIDIKQITLQSLSCVPIARGMLGEIKERYLAYHTEGEEGIR